MPEKKRSREEFEEYLRKVLDQEYPKTKYNSPDSWHMRAQRNKNKH